MSNHLRNDESATCDCTDSTSPPRRPTDKQHLGFVMRNAVQWFSPPTLARAAAKVVLSAAFGDYLDKREMEQTLDDTVFATEPVNGEVWVDFIADTADGFNQTYSVAWCASRPVLEPTDDSGRDVSLPRAQLIVFGGDEVYPYATPKEYEDRFCGPYLASLPFTPHDASRSDGGHPRMLAIPGNHDWYDGLTGFMRLFAQPGWIGGRRLEQKRSYFAVDLPGPFWLWGIDIQSDSYVDAAQIEYFRSAAEAMSNTDALILCTAKPSWTDVADAKDAYRNLSFVERTMVPPGVRTILMLSGDSHHYARYEACDGIGTPNPRMRITAGGGGAFLSTTTTLDDRLDLPKPRADTGEKEPFKFQAAYPTRLQSRLMSWRIFLLALRNPWFMAIPATLYLLLYLSSAPRLASQDDKLNLHARPGEWSLHDFLVNGTSAATAAIVLGVAALLSAFYIVPKRVGVWRTRIFRTIAGVLQTVCHVLAQATIAMICVEPFTTMKGWNLLWSSLMVGVAGGVVGSLIFATFLFLVFNLFGWNSTEAFSCFRYSGYKNFLRIKVTEDAVTIYPIGIEKICHNWDYDAGNQDPTASWLTPRAGSIQTRLIEPEFTIPAPNQHRQPSAVSAAPATDL